MTTGLPSSFSPPFIPLPRLYGTRTSRFSRFFGLRPSVETGLALYTAVLCRSAGFTDCPEFEGFERPALPKGADLGTLLVDFFYPESKNPGVWETPGFGVQDAAEFAAG